MNAPTILIGLGGTGCKIVERVAQMVTPEERRNIAFAVFDTDINDLKGIQERNPFIKTIQTSTKQTVGEYLNKDTHARDEWFPVNAILNGKTLTEGAGQVRSISRLALETVIRAGKMEPLHEAIQSLYKVEEDKPEQALRVVITSSLAGGTGSGLILPVAMYVRNYLATRFRQSANITRGFFILPEVFHEVIVGQTERNNLSANAYATLRELDAFLMKGDDTLHPRYRNTVKIDFPRTASEGYEEYSVRPYDFCFLFDAQNAEGRKLNSFDQYLDHAANCIYSQSIGPMNKRSNSSEDNTIRKLAKERGRNRYAGAGVSMIIYPFEDIKKFIALKWAQQCVSKQWMMYDDRYKEICKENAIKRDKGLYAQDQSLSSFYAAQIETDSSHDVPFAMSIIKSTGIYENGVTRTSNRWEDYVQAVKDKVENDINQNLDKISDSSANANQMLGNLGNDWNQYSDAYSSLIEYRLLSEAFVEEVGHTIGYTMFRGSVLSTDQNQDYKLDTYLKSQDGTFLHPNAIRYMLIKIKELFAKEKETVDLEVSDIKEYFGGFEKNAFDNTATSDVTETVDDLADRKVSIFSRWTKNPTGDQNELKKKLRNYMNHIEQYTVSMTQSIVLKQGLEFIDDLIAAFEGFYKSFESKVITMNKEINAIYKKYAPTSGNTVRYVCASKECLDKIYSKKPYTGSALSLDSELSKEIYNSVLEYSLLSEKPNNNRYFNAIFDDGIIGYFEKCVMRNYGSDLDVDIITALENEADFEGIYEEADDAYELIDQYVRKTINDVRMLSCPFIESPLGEPREPINSCTFHSSLKPSKGDDSPRAKLIKQELMNYGGSPDDDIPKNKIMFYQSFYGLRANDLSKFAPPEKSLTYNRSGGEYFKAYYELVAGINPETHKSKEISPHIDRSWHIVTKMPDLDDDNQAKQEYEIYAAFFWGLLNKYIYLTEEGRGKMIYKLKNVRLNMEDDRLVVSNGTVCDRFYEVLDAVAIYPELIKKITDKIDSIIRIQINDNVPLDEGILLKNLKNFKIEEPGIGPDKTPAFSIFDIPLVLKKSASSEDYDEESAVELINVVMREIYRYVSNYCNPKDVAAVVKDIIEEQFNKHLESLELEKQINETIYKGTLFDKTCDTIIGYMEEIEQSAYAREIQSKVDELRG